MLQQARMPFVRFDTVVAETRDAEGHALYKNKYYVFITPAGGKDELMKDAEEWITELRRKGETRGAFDNAAGEYTRWYEHFSKGFDAYKKGEEMQTTGTPIRACLAYTKAEIATIESVRIYSIEDLAACNEEEMRNMGIGGRTMKQKAIDIMETSKNSRPAEEMAAMRQKIEEMQDTINAMKDAGMKEPARRGRPPQDKP